MLVTGKYYDCRIRCSDLQALAGKQERRQNTWKWVSAPMSRKGHEVDIIPNETINIMPNVCLQQMLTDDLKPLKMAKGHPWVATWAPQTKGIASNSPYVSLRP